MVRSRDLIAGKRTSIRSTRQKLLELLAAAFELLAGSTPRASTTPCTGSRTASARRWPICSGEDGAGGRARTRGRSVLGTGYLLFRRELIQRLRHDVVMNFGLRQRRRAAAGERAGAAGKATALKLQGDRRRMRCRNVRRRTASARWTSVRSMRRSPAYAAEVTTLRSEGLILAYRLMSRNGSSRWDFHWSRCDRI